jgi:NAD(P)-dependent dehydrogenase (short-subunit alcohol dehydrogenase family)
MPRRILILGASSTLGSAIAELLQSQGEDLWLTGRRSERVEELTKAFPSVRISQLDALDFSQILRLQRTVQQQWGRVDGLISVYGCGVLKPAYRLTNADITEVTRLNLESLLQIGREFYPLLLKGQQPAVVLFSSTMGLVGAPGMSAYAATKSAIASVARVWAVEWAPRRIRVNAVAPGIVRSPLVEGMFASLTPEQIEAIRSRHPLDFGTPADVAHAVSFLVGPAARWITGVVLPVDGGYAAQ